MTRPDPDGWYCLATSDELKPKTILTRRFLGQDVVVFRTESGTPAVMSATCPHLGAHFGHGGKVVGECIRCPFHHFDFDSSGQCIRTPYEDAKAPPQAKAKTWPIEEVNGVIMAYHSAHQAAPTWSIPALDSSDWLTATSKSWRMRSHPQETTENSVDTGHFAIIHGFKAIETIKAPRTEGPYLTAEYRIHREAIRVAGLAFGHLTIHFKIHIYGLGYSLVETRLEEMGIETRQFVLSRPADPGEIDFRISLALRKLSKSPQASWWLKLMPSAILSPLFQMYAFHGFKHDVLQDFPIWENKKLLDKPALAKGDGPIGMYRRWVKQFYPETPLVQLPEPRAASVS